jgi:hypothetical protein
MVATDASAEHGAALRRVYGDPLDLSPFMDCCQCTSSPISRT